MNTKYSDLINQTYYFPQTEFKLNKDNLQFHNIDLMKLVEHNINHLYSVNPDAITANDYLEILNYYGDFQNQAGFHTAHDINQYITDGRFLDEFDLKTYVKTESDEEIT
mgnify:CR=1 FL=1